MEPRNRNWCGFTLVELLVVVAIIALLIAMLLPALTNARRQAYIVVCKSNLHQIAVGFQMYSGEYNGAFPPLNVYGDLAYLPDGTPWPIGTTKNPDTNNNWNASQWYTNRLAVYVPVTEWNNSERAGSPGYHAKVWVCPEAPANLFAAGSGGGYGVANNIIRYYCRGGAYKPGDVKRPASIFLIGDAWYPTSPTLPYSNYLYLYPPAGSGQFNSLTWGNPGVMTAAGRHYQQSVCLTYYDGHASSVPYDDLNANVDLVFSPDK